MRKRQNETQSKSKPNPKSESASLKQVKALIQCCLLSVPSEISLNNFMKLYKEQTKETIPFRELGYVTDLRSGSGLLFIHCIFQFY